VRAERDVRPPALESLRELAARQPLQRDLHAVLAGRERVEQRRHVLGGDARGRHLQRAAGLRDGPPRLLRERQDLAGQRRQAAAPRGQRDPAALAHEQLVAQLLAQRGHGHRHGRLGHLQLGGGGLDRPEPGHEHERLELRERHLSSVATLALYLAARTTLALGGDG
jgi:hypothetical protein